MCVGEKDVIIGSGPECDVSCGDDHYISGRHVRLTRSDGMFYVEDLGSSNGSYLRIRRPIILEIGDEVVIGTSVLRLEEVDEQRPRRSLPCPR